NMDMSFFEVADASNGSLHPDSGDDPFMLHSSFEALLLAENSALEHQVLNSYLRQTDSISTVKLLQMAQTRSATNGQSGILAMTANNYAGFGNTSYGGKPLKNHDPALWATITGFFSFAIRPEMNVAFVPPGALTNQSNSYYGMGAFLWTPVGGV